MVDALRQAARRRGDAQPGSRLAQSLRALDEDYPAPAMPSTPLADATEELAAVFGLDTTDCTLLWVAAAPELDGNVGLAYAQLAGHDGIARASVSLALELAGVATAAPEALERLGAHGRLRRHGLLEITGTHAWLARTVHVPEAVLRALVGRARPDPLIAPLCIEPVALNLPGAHEIARAVAGGTRLVWIRSAQGAAGVTLAAGAADALGVGVLAIDLRLRGADHTLRDVLAAAVRDAGLTARALLLAGAEALCDAGDPQLLAMLDAAAVPVFVVAARAWNPGWLDRLPLLIEAERLDAPLRERIWRAQLGPIAGADAELRQTLLGLRMTPESVVKASRYARLLATARDEPVSAAIVREAARRTSGPGGTTGDVVAAGDADSGPGFSDLLLAPSALDALHRLVNWVRHRDDVAAQGLLPHRGRGIAALFAGNPGTGKTLAANVVASQLSIDLFQVDLSAVVDKYIGETEKNLEKVFQAAEALDVVLFFDEADALFGSRSEVHDARDRYANQEIAYLLQRMEQFDGVTILATNLRANLDRAFSRRMSFVINFPDPDAALRRRLWEHHLAQLDQTDDADPVQLDFLAETAELTGGDIRNVVRAAAYDAVGADESVGMRHIAAATVAEYHKLGKVLPDHAFRGAVTRSR